MAPPALKGKVAPSSGPVRTSVKQWNSEIGVPWLDVTSQVSIEPSTSQLEASAQSGPWPFGVEVGSGVVYISMTIAWPEHHAPHYPKAKAGTANVPIFRVPFECTAEGDPEVLPPGNDFKPPKPHRQVVTDVIDDPMSVAVEVYFWKEHPNDRRRDARVPKEVMDEWMKQLNILHIVVNTTVTLAEDGKGSFIFGVQGSIRCCPQDYGRLDGRAYHAAPPGGNHP